MSRDDPHSAWSEPHLRPGGSAPHCKSCGYALAGLAPGVSVCPECARPLRDSIGADSVPVGSRPAPERRNETQAAEHTVWDEPALGDAPAPEDTLTYRSWLERRTASSSWLASWLATGAAALFAGPWAVAGVLLVGLAEPGMWGMLALVVVGPVVEEVMKIAAATLIVELRPWLFRTRAQIIAAAGAAGFVFAAMENVLYLHIYIPDATAQLALWRWTVCVALHVGCTGLAGVGLARVWKRAMDEGRRPELQDGFPWLVAAIVIHGAYNAAVTIAPMLGFEPWN